MRLLSALFVVWLSVLPNSFADTVTMPDGTAISGDVERFEGGVFTFRAGGQIRSASAGEVRSIVFEADAESDAGQSLARLEAMLSAALERLDRLELVTNQLAVNQEADAQRIIQRLFELNPVSRLWVERDRGEFRRDAFRVSGVLRNGSEATIRYPMVQLDLLGANGRVLASKREALSSEAIGPGGAVNFQIQVPRPPPFKSYRIAPVIEYASEGGYRPERIVPESR